MEKLTQSVEEYLASFKVWNRQTVGGNICASLPAGPMVTMCAALEASYTLWSTDGSARVVPAIDFVTAFMRTAVSRRGATASILEASQPTFPQMISATDTGDHC